MSFFSDIFDAVADWFSSDGASTVASAAETIVQGAQLVGGVLAAAGAITGNSKLLKIGAGIGLGATAISAFSGLADAASAGNYTGAADTTEAVGSSASNAASSAAMPGVPDIGNLAPESTSPFESGGGLIGSAMANSSLPAPEVGSLSDAVKAPDLVSTASLSSVASDMPLAAGSAGGADALRLGDSTLGESTSIAKEAASKLAPEGQGLIGSVLGFAKKNPEIVKLGAGLIGGAVQGYQQDAARRDQQRMYEDQRARFNRSILDQNLNRP